MKKTFLFLFYIISVNVCNAQWTRSGCPDILWGVDPWGGEHYGNLGEVGFYSETEALYYASSYISPSSGSSYRFGFTTDGFVTSTITSQSSISLQDFYGFYNVPDQRVLFEITRGGSTCIVARYRNGIDFDIYYNYVGNFMSFDAPDSAVNYLVYYGYLNSQYSILKYDHGNIDPAICTFPNYIPRNINFPVIDTGYVLASYPGVVYGSNIILKSVDSGVTWTEVYNDTTIKLYDLYFTTPDLGYAVGELGMIVKTTDGGQSWQRLNTGFTDYFNSVAFPDANTGFICAGSKMISTLDGGLTWNLQSFPSYVYLSDLHFVNDSIGFVQASGCAFKINTGDFKKKWGSNESLQIIPNPSINGSITILVPEELKYEHQLTLKAYSSDGKIVIDNRVDITYNIINFTNVSLSPGIYFLNLTNGTQSYTGKLLLER